MRAAAERRAAPFVRAALRAAVARAEADRRAEARLACRDRASREAALRGSRFKTRVTARETRGRRRAAIQAARRPVQAGSVPHKLNEFAILITARFWNSQYEWAAHHRYGLQAGREPDLVSDLAAGKRPASMDADEAAVYDFCHELLYTRDVSDKAFAVAKANFGERGVVDLIGVMGYYNIVSLALNSDRYPLPDGAKPELEALNQ